MPFGLATAATTTDGRHMGRLLEFDFDGTAHHATYRSFAEQSQAAEVDAGGGSDYRLVPLLDRLDETVSATIVDKAPSHAAYAAFFVGAEGELVWRPTGTGTGKKEHTADVRVNSRSRTYTYNGVTVFDVTFRILTDIVVTTQA
jgi:hypothetical protein